MGASKRKGKAGRVDKPDTRKAGKDRRNWKPAFLAAFRNSGNVRAACEQAKISRQTAYDTRKTDGAFAAEWDAAEDDACDLLEQEARRRAYEGTSKPVTYQGEITATYQEYSDTLLMFLLKAHRPQKFAERTRSENFSIDVTSLSEKQLELLASGASIATVLAAAGEGGVGAAPAAQSSRG